MATKPTPGGSDGTYGAEMNAFLDISLASDGKVKDGAVFSTSAAPSVDAGVANKKYVDDQITAAAPAISTCKGWVQHNSAGVLQGTGFNVASTAKNSTGNYTVTWDTNFADTTYAAVVTPVAASADIIATIESHGAGSLTYHTANDGGTLIDAACHVIAFGNQ